MDLNAVSQYKVLVVGDGIIDEYYYVTTIGKSIKENVISSVFKGKESWYGGAWAAAKHVRDFCSQVDVMTGPEKMINWKFVDDLGKKLFSVHEKQINEIKLGKDFKDYDLVIVTDFGHGAITQNLINRISAEAKYLCVNAQTNSTNYGFNVVTKFPRADFVVIDELEARLAVHDRDSPLEDIIKKLGFKKIIVTKGNKGAIGYDGQFHHAPAVAKKIVDTMGAGDAFLCVTSPFALAGFSMPDLLKIGNAAGAIKVGIMGHKKSVTKKSMEKMLESC